MRKSSKSGVISSVAFIFVALALLNVFTFVIPFNKISQAVLLTSYIMAEVVIILLGVLLGLLIFKEEDADQRILSIPMLHAGFYTLVAQIIVTVIFYVCNAYIELPIWIVIIVETLIVAFLIVQFALGFFFKTRTREYKESIGNTKFMDNFRANISIIVTINKNNNIKKQLENLLDVARGSDPVSSDATSSLEEELSELALSLRKVVESGLEADSLQLIEKVHDKIVERNIICKANK